MTDTDAMMDELAATADQLRELTRDASVATLDAQGPGELLDDFDLQRAASIAILRRVEGEIWQRSGVQPEYGTLTLRTWLDHWLDHDRMHLAQIAHSLSV